MIKFKVGETFNIHPDHAKPIKEYYQKIHAIHQEIIDLAQTKMFIHKEIWDFIYKIYPELDYCNLNYNNETDEITIISLDKENGNTVSKM